MKIQNRIVLIFTVLTAGIILSLSIFLYIFTSGSIAASFYHRLEVRAKIVGHAALQKDKSQTSIYYDIKEKHLGDLPDEQHWIIWKNDTKKADSLKKKLPLPQTFYDEIIRKQPARFSKNDTSYVGMNIIESGENIIVLSSAVDLYGLEEMENLKSLLVTGFLISLLFVITFGKLFSIQIFSPIRRIIRNVKGISAHNLNQRLSVDSNKDEISDLATTFNDMLDRLEITFDIQNNFVSNASHEFKTPLTIISGESQINLSDSGLSEQVRESFRTIFREAEKMEHLTNSMLSLAQTGFDGKKEKWEALRIDELMFSVKETSDKIMPGNAVEINFDELPENEQKLVINGNETLLKAAFSNIVLNSCKYSDNKPVLIKIKADENHVIVEITDQGIGIPDREMSQIFVPFFRASNTGKYKGYGIGLPLANNIIKLHQGNIVVDSKVGVGTRFIIYLPTEV
ncbi:ATP-binding protein [Dyadobacter subterraneus]|uniref:histidine kinase n=1 Tax=Dyadobacter subterraneus TaxID=2773304 RepID=A0ABR9WFE2_9BACT|nr:HAMP domain-containing sensor histidine kinase [Dyadobacter subterraneus]MBE9464218.1 HAMP domain-containing histidine kinase [Dyadobacter subterraneus]